MNKFELHCATGNAGKFEEIKNYMDRYAPSFLLKQFSVDIEEIQSLDQKVVAIAKAKKAWEMLKKPLLIDDGGIFFEGYQQFPGTLSKYVLQGLGFEGLFKLVDDNHRAAFIMQMVYVDENNIELFEGRCDGVIVRPDKLTVHPHLPFISIFKPNGSDKTFAELRKTPEFEKYSFRYQALKQFVAWHTMHYKGQL